MYRSVNHNPVQGCQNSIRPLTLKGAPLSYKNLRSTYIFVEFDTGAIYTSPRARLHVVRMLQFMFST